MVVDGNLEMELFESDIDVAGECDLRVVKESPPSLLVGDAVVVALLIRRAPALLASGFSFTVAWLDRELREDCKLAAEELLFLFDRLLLLLAWLRLVLLLISV